MPLKGSVLQSHFPSPHMRESSDVDILFDVSFRSEVHDLMVERGYTASTFGHHDLYRKPPIYNFEMHLGLVSYESSQVSYDYFRDVRWWLVPSPDDPYSLRFIDEDFYVYMVFHAAEHAHVGGTGIRTIVDFHVANQAMGETLDRDYIALVLGYLGLDGYERTARSLARKLFGEQGGGLDADEEEMLADCMASGVYGSVEGRVEHKFVRLERESGSVHSAKAAYVLGRMFPPYENMSRYNDFLKEHPAALPLFWAKRIAGAVVQRAKWRELGEAVRR